ncbi:MAG: hypothetical protein V4692_12910, partial [Bdellovibrionota bacterium]
TTSEIFCQQLYTEIVKPGEELMAHFRCKAIGTVGAEAATIATETEKVEQVFEGHVLLKSTDQFKTWQASDGSIRAHSIQFLNGVRIDSSVPSEDDAPAAPESTDKK